MDMSTRRFTIKLLVLLIWIGLGWTVLALSPAGDLGTDLENWRPFVEELRGSPWALPAFILVYILGCLIVFPMVLLGVTGGFLFGAWKALLAIMIAATTGAGLSFLLGRFVGRDFFERHAGTLLHRLDRFLSGMGWRAVLSGRLLFMPFAISNYICGVLNLKLRDFLIGSMLGMLPGTWAACELGAGLEKLTFEQGDFPWIPVVFRVLLAILIVVWSIRLERQKLRRT